MKILFLGTPAFAVPSLEKLLKSGHKVVGIVTQPDRPRGRCRTPQPPPVKELALSKSLPVFQPERPSDPAFLSEIKKLGAECAAVVAYGRILPKEFLNLFRHGAINLHASLLPKYRGAAPIQWSIIRGEQETGVTVFELDEQLDHGPVILQQKTPIKPDEDAAGLATRLSETGGLALIEALDLIETGMTSPVPQEEAEATHAPILAKEDGIIRWELPAAEIRNRIRGMQPWPSATTSAGEKSLKILSATAVEHAVPGTPSVPGTVVLASPHEGLFIQTGKGVLRIERLQPSGGNPMSAAEFLRGHPLLPGLILT
ncbi:MAG: methionyl-tRNA formyltransferase [Candidatus Omnitrophota bacterium]|nr:methionyl-tRNA formyltransferase [Candidatus Omnitrophota bacterium]